MLAPLSNYWGGGGAGPPGTPSSYAYALKIFYSSTRPCYLALGIQYYRDCSNNDLELMLIFLQQVQQWEVLIHKIPWNVIKMA